MGDIDSWEDALVREITKEIDREILKELLLMYAKKPRQRKKLMKRHPDLFKN